VALRADCRLAILAEEAAEYSASIQENIRAEGPTDCLQERHDGSAEEKLVAADWLLKLR